MKVWKKKDRIKPIESQKEADEVLDKIIKITCDTTGCTEEEATKRYFRYRLSDVAQGLVKGLQPTDKKFQFITDLYMSTPSYSEIKIGDTVIEVADKTVN